MTQTLHKREAPLNLGGGWAASAPFRSWSSCHRRRRGAPIYKRRQHYGPKAEYEPQRKQPKPRYGPGPWFQPPQSPYWGMYSNWGCWGGPWCPPPMGYRKPPSPGLVARMYGLHPVCLCCCFCWRGPWNPGWARAPVRKKRWGRRGRGLRRQPSRPVPRSPSVEVSPLLQPVDLYGWRAPGLQAPRNTTQFIMNQIYEDMRQQEKLERQQAQAGGNDAPPSGDEEDAEMQDALYGFGQNPSLAFSPAPEEEENHSPAPQLVEEEQEEKVDEECDEEECDEEECDEECDGKDEESEEEESEEEEEDEEAEAQDEEEVEEAEDVEEVVEEEEAEKTEEKEEGLEEEEQRGEENHLPLEMPLSFLMAEEESANFIDCSHLSPEQVIPKVSQEALLMLQDTDY
uniref:Coiled-coil glutamate rich protein 1 n=1 Tax=Myotis myotis TaxID=51298 RepID=A0A7J7Z0Q4_MYOMY|nr:coiled-coil glutamate rich protein 1 [Myotis myotis]